MTTALKRISVNEEYFNEKIMGSARLSQYWRVVSPRPSFKSAIMNAPNVTSTLQFLIIFFLSLTTFWLLIRGILFWINKQTMSSDF